jgi:hypothetical protein
MKNIIQFDLIRGELLYNDQPLIDSYTTAEQFQLLRLHTAEHMVEDGLCYEIKPIEILPDCACLIVDFSNQYIHLGCYSLTPDKRPYASHNTAVGCPMMDYPWGYVLWLPDNPHHFVIGITRKPTLDAAAPRYLPAPFTSTHCVLPDCTGVYVIHNLSKNMYYVGQAQSVNKRLKQHFSGRGGNGDIYADYKYGDKFAIQIHKLRDSQFDTLDAMERYYIRLYHADMHGYNKTKGNNT